MALIKYTEILKFAEEKLKEVMAPIRANEMRKKAELEIAKLAGVIAEKEQTIQKQASTYPIDFDELCVAIDDLELNQRKLTQLQKIVEELF